jgi:hypothetical protein
MIKITRMMMSSLEPIFIAFDASKFTGISKGKRKHDCLLKAMLFRVYQNARNKNIITSLKVGTSGSYSHRKNLQGKDATYTLPYNKQRPGSL